MPDSMPTNSAKSDYVRAALLENGITFEHPGMRAALIDELAYCLFPEIHEGNISPYGSMIVKHDPSRINYDFRLETLTTNLGSDEANRRAANGVSSFYFRNVTSGRTGIISCALWHFESELQTFTRRDDSLRDEDGRPPKGVEDLFFVQRYRDGTTRALVSQGVIQISHNSWEIRPYQYDFPLAALIREVWSDEPDVATLAEMGRSIARLAVHMLSPQRVGATLVLRLQESDDDATFDRANEIRLDLSNEKLYLRDRHSHIPLVNLIRQLDGCVIFERSGKASAASVWLNLGNDEPVQASFGGTRQRSAREASKKIDGIVVTVSSDGPVRAFIGGALRLSTKAGEIAVPDAI